MLSDNEYNCGDSKGDPEDQQPLNDYIEDLYDNLEELYYGDSSEEDNEPSYTDNDIIDYIDNFIDELDDIISELEVPDIEQPLTVEEAEIIQEAWKEKYEYSVLIEAETKKFNVPSRGYIYGHIIPLMENKSDSYYTVWKNEDYRRIKNPVTHQYTIEYYSELSKSEEFNPDEYNQIVYKCNNLWSAIEMICKHWKYNRSF